MEIRGVPIKKELIEKYKNDPCISKLYFYLLRNDSKEAESYFKSIIKVLNTLNIPYEEEITFSFNDAKERIKNAKNIVYTGTPVKIRKKLKVFKRIKI